MPELTEAGKARRARVNPYMYVNTGDAWWIEAGDDPYDDLLYEYACHEGNYAMGNILRGARLLENEYYEKKGQGASTGSGSE